MGNDIIGVAHASYNFHNNLIPVRPILIKGCVPLARHQEIIVADYYEHGGVQYAHLLNAKKNQELVARLQTNFPFAESLHSNYINSCEITGNSITAAGEIPRISVLEKNLSIAYLFATEPSISIIADKINRYYAFLLPGEYIMSSGSQIRVTMPIAINSMKTID